MSWWTGKEWVIPGTYADRGDKYVEKDGQLVTDAEKGIKITEIRGRESYCYRCVFIGRLGYDLLARPW